MTTFLSASPFSRVAAFCLLASVLLLVACGRARKTADGTHPAQPKTSTDIPVTHPEDRLTVHYHRLKGDYTDANLWTWDGYNQHTPQKNTLAPLGQDDYGLVFQLDRSQYGGSDKIGLIPRLGADWSRKDGGDRYWTPTLGNEVWLLGGKDAVLAQRPDLSPHIVAAYLDSPNAVAISLTEQPTLPAKVTIYDQSHPDHLITADVSSVAAAPSFMLNVLPGKPLDVVHGRYQVQVEDFGPAVPLVLRGVLDDRELFFDADAKLGATYSPRGTTFRVFAPTASAVSIVLYDEEAGGQGRAEHPLASGVRGLWAATVNGDLRGKFYTCTVNGPEPGGPREILDPYAVNAVASSTRARVTELPPPPAPGPKLDSPTDAVIYEMHVRDFTVSPSSGVQKRGLYLGFTEAGTHLPDDPSIRTALDHLVELGVTHVELLPVQDYANDETNPAAYNWGYITQNYFSPEGVYATHPDDDSRVRDFRALVDALHARGIGVIMDVVYNHTAEGAAFDALGRQYYYRHLPDGALANGSGCGNEFRSEAPMARKLILDSLKYWTTQYGIDGYRFDLMALLDRDTMRAVEKELHAIRPDLLIFGEPWMAGGTPLRDPTDKTALQHVPVGAFNDDFRNALKGSPDGNDPGFIQNGSNRDALKTALQISPWFASPAQSINYMTCHDNLVLWDKLKLSMPGADDAALVETMKLGYLALFTAQGVPFLHGGEEFARSKGGNHNSYDAPDSVNAVDWTLKKKRLDLFHYCRDLIALRKAHPVFRLRTIEEVASRLVEFLDTSAGTLAYTLDANGVAGESWKRVCVVLNSNGAQAAAVALPEGAWSVALDEHGAATAERTVSGKVSVRAKSGLVLYQR